MRCHLSSPTATAAADKEKMQASSGGVQGGLAAAGYGLRENPKKTWRLSDSTTTAASFGDLREKSCRECGREFQSWKALFGHMRCHSEKIGKAVVEEQQLQADDEEQGSWSGGGGSHIDGVAISVAVLKKKRRSRRAGSVPATAPVPASSYSISEFSKEQEDVAGILMMLSRDVGYWGSGFGFGFSHVAESSDKNSAALVDGGLRTGFNGEIEENSHESFKRKKKRMGSDGIDSDVKKYSLDAVDSKLGSKYECTTCNKSFHTYQALGGHRASHKRMRGCFMPPSVSAEGSEQSLENAAAASIDQQPVGNHQCHICGKVFGSGQALGGHKRSHLVMASPSTVVIRQQEEEEEEEAAAMSDLIDLNLPAPVDEDSSKGSVSVAAAGDEHRSWWAGSNLQHEAMIGMIAN